MIYDNLLVEIKNQMKECNSDAVKFLRYLNAQIQNRAMDSKSDITDEIVIAVCKTELKKIAETIKNIPDSDNSSLIKMNMQQSFIDKLLPEMMDEETTRSVISSIIEELEASSIKDMGTVMKAVKEKYNPAYLNMKLVSTIVKETLS